MLRILAGTFVTVCVFMASHASACSRPSDWSEEQAVGSAKEIFTALVTKVELSPDVAMFEGESKRYIVKVFYERKEIIKGQPTETGPVTTSIFYMGGCGIPMVVGIDYLFFIEPFEADVPEKLTGGSSGLISIFNTQPLPPLEDEAAEIVSRIRSLKTSD
ncbi:MAG: hypothetical protein GY789_16065 [Hyphomicrobiales bacterium]|nr:hypothetical protein [Hyphomicrobiales bacterium]MCP5002091.1 hypothetical protein [Hyphomicrobiales bacterium]